MKVRCERDGREFTPTVLSYPVFREDVEESGYFAFNDEDSGMLLGKQINCPTCGRGYMKMADGTWESDRKLTILKEA